MRLICGDDRNLTFNIAIVISRFNEEVTVRLYESAVFRLKELGFSDDQITVAWVPGAIEIPLLAQQLAKTNAYEAVVCLGAVIRGETSHYDYVCSQVSDGCQRVALDFEMPIIFGVLTTENEEQAMARAGGQHSNKGSDSIDAAIEMVAMLRQLA